MGKTILSLAIAIVFVVSLVQKGAAQDTAEQIKKYMVQYVNRLDGTSEAELEAKDSSKLVDEAIISLQKQMAENEGVDVGQASLYGQHIQFLNELKNHLNGPTPRIANQPSDQTNKQSLVHHVESEADFHNQVKNAGNKVVLIDFFAVWCPPCKFISPYLDTFAQKYASQLVVLKVDVDKLGKLSEKYRIASMPTFVFLKNGESVERFSGAERIKIENTIKALIE